MNRPIAPTANSNIARSQNVGNIVSLDGSNPNSSGKLVRVDDDSGDQVPWLFSVSSTIIPTESSDARENIIIPVAKGFFGPGGATQNFECDAKPDSILSLPGTTADVKAVWDRILEYTAFVGPAVYDVVNQVTTVDGHNALPRSAQVTGGVKHGSPATPSATRTRVFTQVGNAPHNSLFIIPPFSNSLMLYLQTDANYAGLTFLTFFTTTSGTGQIISYTGAQVLAFKNAGVAIPIPGTATSVGLLSALPLLANRACFLSFNLNL